MIYLFYRAGGHTADWVYRTSTDGGYTWGSATPIINSGPYDVWYVSFRKGKDSRIHVAWVWKDESNQLGTDEPEWYQRYNVYYMYRDYDGSWKNIEGQTLTLPITKAVADTYCLVYRTDSMSPLKHCNNPTVSATASGKPFIVFVFGDLYGGWNYEIRCAKWNGSSWDIVTVTETTCYASSPEINAIDDNNIEIFTPAGGVFCGQRNEFARGGQIEKWVSHDGGSTFSLEKVIARSPNYCLIMSNDTKSYLSPFSKSNIFNDVQMIENGNEEFKIIFCAWTPAWDESNRGVFIWGEDGFKGSNTQDGYVRIGTVGHSFRCALYTTDYTIDEDVVIEASAEMDNELLMCIVSNMQSNGECYSGNVHGEPYNVVSIARIDYDANYTYGWLESLADAPYNPELNQKYLLQLIKRVDGYIEFRVNGASINATNTVYSEGNPGIGMTAGGKSSSTGNVKFWWLRVRKYTEPEPSVNLGAEEAA